METSLIDRPPHAEDVSPEDVWGDVVGLEADSRGAGTALPPKRVKEETQANSAAEGEVGLRIGGGHSGHASGDAAPRLEVQEIDGCVVRLDPETASEPWAPRQFTFHQRPAGHEAGRGAAGEARDWGKPRKQPVIWIFGSGLAVVVTIVGAVMLLPSIDKSIAARPRPGDTELVLEPDGMTPEAVDIKNMLARQAEAEGIFRALVTAPSAADMLPLLRDAGEITALIQTKPYPPGALAGRLAPKTDHWTALHSEGLTYGLLKGTFPDHTRFEAYFVMENEKLVLDWKASSGFGTADFGELAQKRGNPAEIRAWISNAGFYTLAFPEETFQCYQLLSPDKQQSVWAYCRRGGDVEGLVNTRLKGGYILQNETESMKATVRLEPGPADALPNQWLIGELLHKDWIAP
jgi:hypothetical protein